MTVDVEEYFQVSAFEDVVDRELWQSYPSRVQQNVDKILQLFSDHEIKGTFFTLGILAKKYPGMIGKIIAEGHELASHGWQHVRATTQSPAAFREDVLLAKNTLEQVSGASVVGYRAASYSINSTNLWAHDVLAETGHRYSSSIVPVRHDHYGFPGAPRFAYEPTSEGLLEIPVTTINLAGRAMNCGGGGWFRLFPYRFTRWAFNKVNKDEQQACVFYFHPWEIDPEQPRVDGIGIKSRVRHYLNLSKVEPRLRYLAKDFLWDRMDRVFLPRARDEDAA